MSNRKVAETHGSMSGYGYHLRYKKLPVCSECKDVYNVWRADRRRNAGIRPAKEIQAHADKRRKEYLNELKTNTPCADCKQHFDPIAMDLDHLIPRAQTYAKYGKSLATLPWDEFWAELKIVEVVCANCHRVRTKNRWLQKSH